MQIKNIRILFLREVNDQIRDRRTLFMIFVLPLLLYPLLGMTFLQVAQFVQEKPSHVLLIGSEYLPEKIAPLLGPDTETNEENDAEEEPIAEKASGETIPYAFRGRFDADLFKNEQRARLLQVTEIPAEEIAPNGDLPENGSQVQAPSPWMQAAEAYAREQIRRGRVDAALIVPQALKDQYFRLRKTIGSPPAPPSQSEGRDSLPGPKIIYTTSGDKSQIARDRLANLLQRWNARLGHENLEKGGLPGWVARPLEIAQRDIAEHTTYQGASFWSKVLPMFLLIWALTGAFYPAIDLCAGEKERGTLETLLCSPALRSEIVFGKMFTIMSFSMITSILNIISMGITGFLVLAEMPGYGAPPILPSLWLLAALVPVSALFSALCLALAAFAKSTKEGQYYLMPLLMITMPLIILPMAPNTELNLGNCLLPITGIVLLLRSFLEGNYQGTLPYIFLVTGVTLACCALAIRWAIDQFNSESVLFRESEQFNLNLWLHRLMQDRRPTPTLPMALLLGLLILIIKFFISFSMPSPDSYRRFVEIAVVTQIVVIAFPAILATMLLTSSARETLKLRMPPLWTLPAVVLLALAVHPFTHQLQKWVMQLYPVSDHVMRSISGIQEMITRAPVPSLLLVIAVLPAVCEEIAFRGFLLSGLQQKGSKWRAIFITAIFFGLTHPILQQSLLAMILGVMIAYLTIQTGSIWPAILYHMFHNGLNALSTRIPARWIEDSPALAKWFGDPEKTTTALIYQWPAILLGLAIAAALLYAFSRLRPKPHSQEIMQEQGDQGK